MWQEMIVPNLSALNLVIRGAVVYLAVVILLRIAGKRQMGQMGPTEFVAILLISNAVQNSMNGGDNSLTGGLILAVVLIVLSSLITYLTYRSRIFSTIFEGTPTILVHDGKLIKKNLFKERLSESELATLLRKQGVHKLDEIGTAILESDGTLSLVKRDDGKKSTFNE
jgi:uncharacterized membrane protein YcaP (DUF421 family)